MLAINARPLSQRHQVHNRKGWHSVKMARPNSTHHDAAEVSAKKSEFEHEEFLSPAPHQGGVDKELSQYITDVAVEISSERNKELVRKLDKRVLPVLIVACLLQALTQSTLPFASIMGLIGDTGMQMPDGRPSQRVRNQAMDLDFAP